MRFQNSAPRASAFLLVLSLICPNPTGVYPALRQGTLRPGAGLEEQGPVRVGLEQRLKSPNSPNISRLTISAKPAAGAEEVTTAEVEKVLRALRTGLSSVKNAKTAEDRKWAIAAKNVADMLDKDLGLLREMPSANPARDSEIKQRASTFFAQASELLHQRDIPAAGMEEHPRASDWQQQMEQALQGFRRAQVALLQIELDLVLFRYGSGHSKDVASRRLLMVMDNLSADGVRASSLAAVFWSQVHQAEMALWDSWSRKPTSMEEGGRQGEFGPLLEKLKEAYVDQLQTSKDLLSIRSGNGWVRESALARLSRIAPEIHQDRIASEFSQRLDRAESNLRRLWGSNSSAAGAEEIEQALNDYIRAWRGYRYLSEERSHAPYNAAGAAEGWNTSIKWLDMQLRSSGEELQRTSELFQVAVQKQFTGERAKARALAWLESKRSEIGMGQKLWEEMRRTVRWALVAPRLRQRLAKKLKSAFARLLNDTRQSPRPDSAGLEEAVGEQKPELAMQLERLFPGFEWNREQSERPGADILYSPDGLVNLMIQPDQQGGRAIFIRIQKAPHIGGPQDLLFSMDDWVTLPFFVARTRIAMKRTLVLQIGLPQDSDFIHHDYEDDRLNDSLITGVRYQRVEGQPVLTIHVDPRVGGRVPDASWKFDNAYPFKAGQFALAPDTRQPSAITIQIRHASSSYAAGVEEGKGPMVISVVRNWVMSKGTPGTIPVKEVDEFVRGAFPPQEKVSLLHAAEAMRTLGYEYVENGNQDLWIKDAAGLEELSSLTYANQNLIRDYLDSAPLELAGQVRAMVSLLTRENPWLLRMPDPDLEEAVKSAIRATSKQKNGSFSSFTTSDLTQWVVDFHGALNRPEIGDFVRGVVEQVVKTDPQVSTPASIDAAEVLTAAMTREDLPEIQKILAGLEEKQNRLEKLSPMNGPTMVLDRQGIPQVVRKQPVGAQLPSAAELPANVTVVTQSGLLPDEVVGHFHALGWNIDQLPENVTDEYLIGRISKWQGPVFVIVDTHLENAIRELPGYRNITGVVLDRNDIQSHSVKWLLSLLLQTLRDLPGRFLRLEPATQAGVEEREALVTQL